MQPYSAAGADINDAGTMYVMQSFNKLSTSGIKPWGWVEGGGAIALQQKILG